MMNRSTRFMSLSGISGVLVGIYALAGVFAAYKLMWAKYSYLTLKPIFIPRDHLFIILGIAAAILAFSILSSIIFSYFKAKKQNELLWNSSLKRFVVNFAIPLVTGGILCLIFLVKGFVGLTVPMTLIFYGMALLSASKYTLNEVRSLGIIEIILGLFACYFIEYSLLLWAIGFGVLHIVYGVVMHIKYGS